MNPKPRVAIVVSHPIQHFCPQFVSFAALPFCQVKVFFASAVGHKEYEDKGFGRSIRWNNLGLERFDHVFLNGDAVIPPDKNLDAEGIEKELSGYSPDVVIVFGYFQKFVRRAMRWAAAHDVPVAFVSDSERRRARPMVLEAAKRFVVTRKFREIDHFLSVGDANEMYYRHYGVPDEKILRMPFPIDISHYREIYAGREAIGQEVRARMNISGDAIVCAVVGKIEDYKRQQDIIEALRRLDNDMAVAPIVLIVIGTGPMQDAITAAASTLKRHRVILTGFVFPEEIARIYAAVDIYVHPSEMDAHSLAISEAIYMGCPVLISDRCGSWGPTDDVQPGRNGLVYRTGDIDALAASLRYLASSPDVRQRYSASSRAFALQAQEMAHGESLRALLELVRNRKLSGRKVG
jgi:glycosyltransferase involved in cell wall biosynthesis